MFAPIRVKMALLPVSRVSPPVFRAPPPAPRSLSIAFGTVELVVRFSTVMELSDIMKMFVPSA